MDSSSPSSSDTTKQANDSNLNGTDATKQSDESASVAVAEVSDSSGDGSKKAVWNKATNGAKEPVMGAESWPALSDKVSSFSTPLQGSGSVPARSPRKQVNTDTHPNTDQRNAHTSRQRSFKKHGGVGSGNTSAGSSQSLSSPRDSPSSQNTSGFHKNLESGNKVSSESNSPRYNNAHRKGTGPHQHGARKDQDRGSRNFNHQGSFNGREVLTQPTDGGLPRGFIRHFPMLHNPGMYESPPLSPTMRPYGPPGSYNEFPLYYVPVPPESIRGMVMPYPVPAPHQMFMQYIDPELYSKVIKQIDYYFSNENLVKDIYLRNNMDEEGWVSIELIAGFKQVQKLTNNIAFIMEAIKTSTVVELKDNKVRRQNDWSKWLMPASLKVTSSPTYRDPGSPSTVVTHIQKINLNKENDDASQTTDPSFQNQGH